MAQEIKAIVIGIKGVISSLSFVKDTLLPYAYNNLPDYVWDHEKEIEQIINDVRKEENNPDLNVEEVIEVLLRYIDEDKKKTPLNTLQEMIWEEGYRSGELVTHIYDDAFHGLRRWKDQHIDLYVYSSGFLLLAQKLLLAYTKQGDLTSFFSGYYDTGMGSKKLPESYEKIAADIDVHVSEILFISDNIEEISAAACAGMNVIILDRDREMPNSYGHQLAHNFDEILPEVVNA